MSILSGPRIVELVEHTKKARKEGWVLPVPGIDIEPFRSEWAGANSYDVTLAGRLLTFPDQVLDMKTDPKETRVLIPEEGLVLLPGVLYLGATNELTYCTGLVPCIETRSSVARLGMSCHLSAGFGDDAFSGVWTLEITVVQPLKIYPNVRVGQVYFTTLEGARNPYRGKYSAKLEPTASQMWKDFLPKEQNGG